MEKVCAEEADALKKALSQTAVSDVRRWMHQRASGGCISVRQWMHQRSSVDAPKFDVRQRMPVQYTAMQHGLGAFQASSDVSSMTHQKRALTVMATGNNRHSLNHMMVTDQDVEEHTEMDQDVEEDSAMVPDQAAMSDVRRWMHQRRTVLD